MQTFTSISFAVDVCMRRGSNPVNCTTRVLVRFYIPRFRGLTWSLPHAKGVKPIFMQSRSRYPLFPFVSFF